MADKIKAQLSIRIEVIVEVDDEAELTQFRESLTKRAADSLGTFWGNPRILHAANIRRAGVDV